MNQAETKRFDELYQRHLRLLKLQGKSKKTIDAYGRAVRRINKHFDCCPEQLTMEQREQYFSDLVKSHPGVPSKLTVMVCSFSGNMS
jgi:integrase/recombinase XerD